MKDLIEAFIDRTEQFIVGDKASSWKDYLIDKHVLNKINPELLETFLSDEKYQVAFSLFTKTSYNLIKQLLCSPEKLEELISHSIKYEAMSSFDKFYTELAIRNFPVKFYNKETQEETSEYFTAEKQELPHDFIQLKTLTLVCPKNSFYTNLFCDQTKLCTRHKQTYINKNHKKLFIYDERKVPLGALTIYFNYNCYAISGIDNAELSEEINNEILEYCYENNLITKDAYKITINLEYFLINTPVKDLSAMKIRMEVPLRRKLLERMIPNLDQYLIDLEEEDKKRLLMKFN